MPITVSCRRQYLGSAEGDHAPAAEHHDLRRQLAHFAGIVADIDHGYAGFVAQAHQIGQDIDLALKRRREVT